MTLKWINPLTNTEDVLNIERPFIDYIEWKLISWREPIKTLNELLNSLDCTREYDCGRPMMTTLIGYNNLMSEYYYHLLKIDNPFIYNEYIDKLIKRHIENIIFEYEHPYVPKIKNKPKRNSKNRTIPNKFIKQKTTNMFTGEDIYIYENLKTGEQYESSNPNLIKEIKQRKEKKERSKRGAVPLSAMTFSFKKK